MTGHPAMLECAGRNGYQPSRPTTSPGGAMNTNERERTIARFMRKVNKTETCWLWTACAWFSNSAKYGRFYLDGKYRLAHRVAYELFVGTIPPGLTIDHVRARGCTSTLCVRPDHLEAVTNRENIMRGGGPSAENNQRQTCHLGHSDWRIIKNWRECMVCKRERWKRRNARLKAERAAKRLAYSSAIRGVES